MPFDIDGARSAGYSDAEIATFLGSQSGFDVDGALKSGYQPSEVVDFLSGIKDRGPADETDPLLRVTPTTTVGVNPTFTTSDETSKSVLDKEPARPGEFDMRKASAARNALDDPRAAAPRATPGERQKSDPMVRSGETFADSLPPVRAVQKARAGAAEGGFGILRAGAELVGADSVARFAGEAAGAAKGFQQGMGQNKPIAGFGPDSPVPYLADMAEGAGSSLLTTAAMASMFGAKAVIPLMSIQSAGQQYDAARNAGQDPWLALANAVPFGVFEAVGEKFQGMDKAAAAMGVLMRGEASVAAKKTAADALMRAGIREIPGEVITYGGQTTVDLLPGIGINQNLTMSQFLDGLRDTVIQAGMMGSVTAGAGAAAKPGPAQLPSPEATARAKGFLTPERDPVPDILSAPTVDAAIEAATQAVAPPVAQPQPALPESEVAVDNIARILRGDVALVEPAGEAPSTALPKAPDVSPTLDDAPGVQPGMDGRSPDLGGGEPAGGLGDSGRGATGEPGAGSAAAVPVEPAGAKPRAVDPRLIPLSKRAQLGTTSATQAQPTATWFGRRGDGYVTQADAQMAIPSRRKIEPTLNWQVEQMPSGKFRLAGYPQAGDLASAAPSPEAMATERVAAAQEQENVREAAQQVVPDGSTAVQFEDAAAQGVDASVESAGSVVGADGVRAVPTPSLESERRPGLQGVGQGDERASAASARQPAETGTVLPDAAQVAPAPADAGVVASAPTERERINAMAQAAKERKASEESAKTERRKAEVEKARGKRSPEADEKAAKADVDARRAAEWDGATAKNRQFYADKGGMELTPKKRAAMGDKKWADLTEQERAAASKGMQTYGTVVDGKVESAPAAPEAAAQEGKDAPQFSLRPEPFYSALQREVAAINAKAQPAQGWLSQIQGLVKAGKVKADEVEWTGVADWLALQDGKVTKEQISDFLKANGVQVKEVEKGAPSMEAVRDRYIAAMQRQGATETEADRMFLEMMRFARDDKHDEALKDRGFELVMKDGDLTGNEIHDATAGREGGDGTKYGTYTLPGGEGYRELLLTLPTQREPADTQSEARLKQVRARLAEIRNMPAEQVGREEQALWKEEERITASMREAAKARAPEYRSGHWDEPNVLAHIRLNDRTDAEGKRVLFVEEIQSDWAQTGKKKGFDTGGQNMPEMLARAEYERAGPDSENWRWRLPDGTGGIQPSRQAAERAAAESLNQRSRTGVPPAPFVGKTDAWVTLALKRIVKLAVDEGYDRVAFVNGEQSAARYDLSQQVELIDWKMVQDSDFATRRVFVKTNNRERSFQFKLNADGVVVGDRKDGLDGKSLADVVGKEVAERIMAAPAGELRDDGLKIGGEGMKAFYDKIVPSVAKDVIRKLGGGGMREVNIPADRKWVVEFEDRPARLFDTESEARDVADRMDGKPVREPGPDHTQPGFDITPAMREKAEQGLPLFDRKPMTDEDLAAVMRLLAVQRGGLPVEKAQKIVDSLTAKWKNGPKVHVVATHRDLPVKAPSDARGLYYKNQVWVVAAAHRDGPQVKRTVARTLAHEAISHYGLREMLGREGWARLMRQINVAIASGNKPLKEIQAEIRRLYVDDDGNFNLSPNVEADEIAARVVEEAIDANGEFRPGFGFIKAVYAKIAEFLRGLGIDVTFSNAELHGMLVLAQRNLQAGKRTAGGGDVLVAAAREDGQAARGTKELMASRKDVVGNNEGGRSADDETEGAAVRAYRVRLVEEDYRLPNLANAVPKEYIPKEASQSTVRVYRAVPSDTKDATIRPGDWVSLSSKYAAIHGTGKTGRSKVISMDVPADHVAWAGTDMNEYFYVPRDPNDSPAPDSDGAQFSRAAAPAAQPAPVVNQQHSPWRDATGRLQFAPGAWLYGKLGDLASPLLAKLGLKAASPELRRQLRTMKLAVQKAQETAAAVAGEAMKLSEAERSMVSDLIEQELAAGTVPPAHAVRLAAMINASMGAQTDELVRLGMLTKDSADLWRGKYLPRFYKNKLTKQVGDAWADALQQLRGRQKAMAGIKGKHLKGRGLYETVAASAVAEWEALGWEVRDPDYPSGDASEISLKILSGEIAPEDTVQVWRDFTRAERDKMGEIRDAGFRFVMGYMQTQRDIALGRIFEGLSNDPEMSAKRESERFNVQVPDGTVPGTGAKRYGKLAGRWVPKEVMSHLSQIDESQSEAWRMYRKALAIWKEGKTALNPVAHVNNTVSNLTMAHLAGVSYHRADKYIAAARDFATKSPRIKDAKDAGLFLGTMSDAELMNVLPEDLKLLVRQQDSAATKIGRTGFNVMTFWLRRPMGWAYQAEDTFFRYLIWKDATDRGMSPEDAVDHAQRYIFAYDDLPKGARMIRDFGIPFFAYTYKAAPALLYSALTHPVRMAAPAAVLWGINAAAYAIAVGDDDDSWEQAIRKYMTDAAYREEARKKERLEREFLPPWNKGTTALGTPKMIRLGMDEVTKLPLFIDVSRIIPGGDLFDVSPNAGGIPLPQPITPSHPLFTTAVAMIGNKDLFRGKELVDKNDTRGEATEKRLDWLWTQLTPAVAAGSYHWDRTMNAIAQASGGEITWLPEAVADDYTGIGRDGLPVQPKYAAMQTFGIKVRPMDLEKSEAIDRSMQKRIVREIDAEMRSLRRLNNLGAVSDRAYERARELADTKKDRIREGQTVDGEDKD